MSSLLQPTLLLESCHSGLRERRRSSINTLSALPRLFTTPIVEGSAICDEDSSCSEQPTVLPSVKQAHLPDHTSKVYITTDLRPLSTPQTPDADTPFSTVPSTAVPSRKPSMVTLSDGIPRLESHEPKMERLNWRLASGFFAYFMCGWGDGGILVFFFAYSESIHRFCYPVTGTVLPCKSFKQFFLTHRSHSPLDFMKEYNISFMTSSLVYAGATIGYEHLILREYYSQLPSSFIIGTVLVESIIAQLGRFDPQNPTPTWIPRLISRNKGSSVSVKTGFSRSQAHLLSILVSSVLHGMFFLMMGFKGGFPVLFCAYALAAFARSILTASL